MRCNKRIKASVVWAAFRPNLEDTMAETNQSPNATSTGPGGGTTSSAITSGTPAAGSTTTGAARAADLGPALKEEGSKLADKSLASGVEVADAVGKAAQSAAQV